MLHTHTHTNGKISITVESDTLLRNLVSHSCIKQPLSISNILSLHTPYFIHNAHVSLLKTAVSLNCTYHSLNLGIC